MESFHCLMYNAINGTRYENPEEKLMKLSDCFVHKQDNPELELVVHQLNINPRYETMPLKDAVTKAIDECINENILKEFL